MSELKKEQLSAFLDGENTEDDFIKVLNQDEELLNSWGRYQLISACMKGQCPDYLDTKLAAKVSSDIANEPTVLAPGKQSIPVALKPLAGLAIAASVATIAIFGIQQHRASEISNLSGQPLAAANAINPQVQRQIQTVSTRNNNVQSAPQRVDSRLNNYVVNHNEYRTQAGVQGMLPYARVVTHRKEQ